MKARAETADPWRDLDIVDSRAVRWTQGIFALLAILAIVFSWEWMPIVLASQMLLGVFWDRRWCLPCLLYYTVIVKIFGPGELEDSRPPRFANLVGATMLVVASLFFLFGLEEVGMAIVGVQVIFALLSCVFGVCVGCITYKALARMRIGAGEGESKLDLKQIPGGEQISKKGGSVLFSHPLCADCHRAEKEWQPDITINVRQSGEIARRAGVRSVPTLIRVSPSGEIQEILLS